MEYYEIVKWNDGTTTKTEYNTFGEAVSEFNITVLKLFSDSLNDAYSSVVIDKKGNVYRRHEEFN